MIAAEIDNIWSMNLLMFSTSLLHTLTYCHEHLPLASTCKTLPMPPKKRFFRDVTRFQPTAYKILRSGPLWCNSRTHSKRGEKFASICMVRPLPVQASKHATTVASGRRPAREDVVRWLRTDRNRGIAWQDICGPQQPKGARIDDGDE